MMNFTMLDVPSNVINRIGFMDDGVSDLWVGQCRDIGLGPFVENAPQSHDILLGHISKYELSKIIK